MASINQVVFTGNVAQEPKILQGNSSLFGDFRLAVSNFYRRADGTSQEETIFLTCKVSGKMAEIANLYLSKGSPVGVTGQLREESWVDKNTGEQKCRLAVKVDTISLLETKSQREVRESRSGSGLYQPVSKPTEIVPLDRQHATAPNPALAQSQYQIPKEKGTLGQAMAESAHSQQRQNMPEIDLDEIPF